MPLRDLTWTPRIKEAEAEYNLKDFDIHVLEGGMSFFRDGRDVRELRAAGKHIVSNYHGLDLRMRGAIKPVWDATELHTTCEFDLYRRYPEIEYLFLPFDTSMVPPANPTGNIIKICHAPRIRSVKGTDKIIEVVEKLSETLPVEMVLIENMSHSEAIMLKSQCHIAIDQIASGDMGYGVNSLESLSMGVCTVTNLSEAYQNFIPDHPFVLAEPHNLTQVLKELILDDDLRNRYAEAGPGWIRKTHHWKSVAEQMHKRYAELGWAE